MISLRALLCTGVLSTASIALAGTPVTPNAFQSATDIITYLETVRSNHQVLSAQHNTLALEPNVTQYTAHAYSLTGHYPAMLGLDLGCSLSGWTSTDVANFRAALVNEATAYWKAGGIVTLCWHQTTPSDPVEDTGGFSDVETPMTQSDFDQVVTPGTTLYTNWVNHVDAIAYYLKQLRDANVPILWRPYHEANGSWFWWGGKTTSSYQQLWRNLYDRLVNYHGLRNLIWVWSNDKTNTNTGYYPGASYVDVGGVDLYTNGRDDSIWSSYANTTLSPLLTPKPYALTENGLLPSATVFQNTNYTWFMIWGPYLDSTYYPAQSTASNTPAIVQDIYGQPFTITRENIRVPVSTECELTTYRGSTGSSLTTAASFDSNYHNGNYVKLNASGAGEYVEFDVNLPVAGTWDVQVGVSKNYLRGIFQASLPQAGVNLGAPQDCYAATQTYTTLDLGTYTFASAGTKQLRLTVTGTSGGYYSLLCDFVRFVKP